MLCVGIKENAKAQQAFAHNQSTDNTRPNEGRATVVVILSFCLRD